MGRPHIIGEVGCYASHYLIWQKCIELNEPVLVFEDHVNIDETTFRNTLAIAEQHIEQCGFIRLQDSKTNCITLLISTKPKPCKVLESSSRTACYAISPKAARSFIEHSSTFNYPVDVFLRNTWVHKHPMFGVAPAGLQRSKQPSIIRQGKGKGKKTIQ